MAQQVKLNDHQKKILYDLFLSIRQEAEEFRNFMIRRWRRNEAFWNNIQKAIYVDEAHSFVTIEGIPRELMLENEDLQVYERVINIYRAHGESFIAALSASLPNAVYTPDYADNADDISTAKAYQKITSLIQTKEEAPLKFIKLLYHLYNHGIGYIYTTVHQDEKYGVKTNPVIDYKTIDKEVSVCPDCGSLREEMDDIEGQNGMGMGMMDGYHMMPDGSMMPNSEMPGEGYGQEQMPCPTCGSEEPPIKDTVLEQIPYISGMETSPKAQAKVEIYGPLHVTVQHHVKNLADSGYLILDSDIDIALAKSIYPDAKISSEGDDKRVDRIPANQPFVDEKDLVTLSRLWLRPWMLYRLNDLTEIKGLQKLFKEGVYAVFVNEREIVEVCDESLDKCWTCTESAISEKIHAEPYGNVMIPIQQMTNDLIALTMETIESEIPINFFDPAALNPKVFKDKVARPGEWVPMKSRQGMALDGAIASTRPANLSKEVPFVQNYLEKSGQFVLGTVPAVYGGQAQGGSETLGEYKESLAQALQRLSVPYIAAASAWVKGMYNASTQFINYLVEFDDEAHYVEDLGKGNFIDVWVKQAEIQGKVGHVGVENSDQLPTSWNQRRTMVMDLINQKNPAFDAILYHPENINYMQNIFGLGDFHIPGDDDRDKQLKEIKEMLLAEPIPGPPGPDGQPQMAPSVQIEPEIDNHQVHAEVIKAFLNSEVGQIIKRDRPAAYQNILAHLNAHTMTMQMQMMQQQPPAETKPPGNNEMDPVNAPA